MRDHSFYVDELARVDFAANGHGFASTTVLGAMAAVDAFEDLDIGVRTAFAPQLDRLRARVREQFARLEIAIEPDTFRSIAEEARLIRQDASRLRHRPELRVQLLRAELFRVEAASRAMLSILSQQDRSQFAQQLETAEQALAESRFRVAERAIEAMEGILRGAQQQQPEYYVHLFRQLQALRHLSTDPARFDMLELRGRTALGCGDHAALRNACVEIVRTLNLPRGQDVDVAALAGLRR